MDAGQTANLIDLGFKISVALAAAAAAVWALAKAIRRGNRGEDKEERAHGAETELFDSYRRAMRELREELAAEREETARIRIRLENAIERGTRHQTEITLLKIAETAARADRSDIVQRLDVQEEHTKLLPTLMTNIFDPDMPLTAMRRFEPEGRGRK